MRNVILLFLHLFITFRCVAQHVGIGTATPVEQLDIHGAVRIGGTATEHSGTIRWNAARSDFEGYNGTEWVSLTGSRGNWGRQDQYSLEDYGTTFLTILSNGVRGKYIGTSLSAVGTNIFTGAPGDFSPGGLSSAGRVYMIGQGYNGWNDYPNFGLGSPAPVADEQFGYSVSAAGEHLVVGAPGWNSLRGRVHFYAVPTNSNPIYKTTYWLGDGANADYFGLSVAVSGDHAFVGSPYKTINGNSNQGRVTVFKYLPQPQTWSQITHLPNPEPAANDAFGTAIDMDMPYAVITSPLKSHSGLTQAGKAYVYHFNGTSWVHQTTLAAPDAQSQDNFGKAACLRGDTLLISATQFNTIDPEACGKVYVYFRDGQQWNLHSTIEPPDGARHTLFGTSVDFRNGTAVIGAPRAFIGLTEDAGKAYVYSLQGTEWVLQTVLSSTRLKDGDFFGNSAVITPTSIIIGAPYHEIHDSPDNGRLFYYYK